MWLSSASLNRSKLNFNYPIIGIAVFSILSSIILVLGGNDPLGTDPTREFYFTLFSFFLGFVALYLIAKNNNFSDISFGHILCLTFILRLISIQAWPLLEDDYFRYLWDGRQTVLHLSPWQFPPTDFFHDTSLDENWHAILSGINNPELPTLYGPVLQYLFGLAYIIDDGQLWPIQLILLLIDLLILAVLNLLRASKPWLLIFAVHPLILKEAMASSHPDSVMVLLILLALFSWKNNAAFITGCFIGLAMMSKISALIILPFFLFTAKDQLKISTIDHNKHRVSLYFKHCLQALFTNYIWKLKVLVGITASIFFLYLPFLKHSASELTSLLTFGKEWRFNPLIYKLIDSAEMITSPRIVAAFIVILGIAFILVRWLCMTTPKRSVNNYPPVDLAMFLLLFLSPVVNSWYWLWVLPLAILNARWWLVIASCTGVLAYVNSNVFYGAAWFSIFNTNGLFEVPTIITLLQVFIILTAYIYHRCISR